MKFFTGLLCFFTQSLDSHLPPLYNNVEVIYMNFTDENRIWITFYEHKAKDHLILELCYDNFEYVTPCKLFRVLPYSALHIILDGCGYLKVNNNTYKLSQGDMFFLPQNVDCCYYPDEEKPWKYAWFDFTGEKASFYGKLLGFSLENPVKKCKSFNNVLMLLEHLFTKALKKTPVGYYDVLAAFYKIVDYNTRDYEVKNADLADAVTEYIKYSYHRVDLSIAEICKHFNISHSYLCRIFKEANNCSVKNYLIKVRINEAVRLLETTTLGVKEIAYSVGFADNIHFMKMFKKYMGKTPTEYREFTETTKIQND